jgi:hypothetical protein
MGNESQNALARWMEDSTEKKEGAWVSATVLFNDWRKWAETNRELVGSQKRFSENLIARGCTQHRKNTGRGFQGILLKKRTVTRGDASVVSPSPTRMCSDHNKQTLHSPSLQSLSDLEGFKNREKMTDPAFDFFGFNYEQAASLIQEASRHTESHSKIVQALHDGAVDLGKKRGIPKDNAAAWLQGRVLKYFELTAGEPKSKVLSAIDFLLQRQYEDAKSEQKCAAVQEARPKASEYAYRPTNGLQNRGGFSKFGSIGRMRKFGSS